MNEQWTKYLPEALREWLDGRLVLQKTIGNTGWLLFDRILRMIIGLTIGAWVARYLGPAKFGELTYVISFIAFFLVIANLQADGLIVRDIAQKPEHAHLILGTTLWLRLIFGVFSWILAICAMYLFHPEDYQLILLTAIVGATLVFQASDTIDLWFQSQSQSKMAVIAKLVSYLFTNSVKVALILCKAPLAAFAGVMCLECAALTLVLTLAYRRHPAQGCWKAGLSQAKTLLNQCWPFIASGFMMTSFSRVDQIMLKEMLGERELGVYAAALPIAQVWHVIPITLVNGIAPVVARRKSRDEQFYQDTLVMIFRLFAMLSICISLLTALLSPWIIKFMYGQQYQFSAIVLSVYVFSNVFIFQGIAQSLWVINNNVRSVTLLGTFLAATIGIFTNSMMISELGTLGAAYSVIFVECLSVIALPCLLRSDLLHLYRRAFIPFRVR